jgi:hypothetical protein
LTILLPASSVRGAEREPIAKLSAGGSQVLWAPTRADYDHLVLTIAGPEDFYSRSEFDAGESPSFGLFDDSGAARAEGVYKWELTVIPVVDGATRKLLTEARLAIDGQGTVEGIVPSGRSRQSGSFSIRDGSFVATDLVEPEGAARAGTGQRTASVPGDPQGLVLTNSDGVIRNSLCVGFDCPNSPAFGDSTVLLMENNTRIKFGDTSNSPFPNRDWEIEANSNLSGGASYLGFNDCGSADNDGGCATELVFAVESGARQSALYVESDGDVGFGTSNPVVDLHMVTGDTPTLRLDQDGSSGFAPQVWDVAGNETNFFIRDVTNGSSLPLRIRPGAPSNSIHIDTAGNVGLGTASPAAQLDVRGPLRVEESDGTINLAVIRNAGSGAVTMQFDADVAGTNPDPSWQFGVKADNTFVVTPTGTLGAPVFKVDSAGNVTIPAGSAYNGSDRNLKSGIVPVEPRQVLATLAGLPINVWSWASESQSVRHLGPMAQDFAAAFRLGRDDVTVAPMDMTGVALAAVQGLHQELLEKDAIIQDLTSRLIALEASVSSLQQ